MDSQVDASSAQVADKPFQYNLAHPPVVKETVLKPTCIELCWVAK